MNGHPSNKEEDVVFVALCDRFLSTTGLDAEILDETLKALRGPDAHDDSCVAFEGDRVILGPVWRAKCRALQRDPAP